MDGTLERTKLKTTRRHVDRACCPCRLCRRRISRPCGPGRRSARPPRPRLPQGLRL